jgi:hypothetical protein
MHFALIVLTCCLILGCAAPRNPSFDLSIRDAKRDIKRMKADPKPLERPVVVVTGWADMMFMSMHWRPILRDTVGQRETVVVNFWGADTFDAARAKVIEAINERWPSEDPDQTIEVDVVAFSMGGLVARYAALPCIDAETQPKRRLKIARLFTLATPHQGADWAAIPTFDKRVIDMRKDSAFLGYVDKHLAEAEYQLIAYARLGDAIVGVPNTAPPGITPWWVHTPPLGWAHVSAHRDSRLTADILRRLRGESPWTTSPPAPAPGTPAETPTGQGQPTDETTDIAAAE